MYFRCKFLCEYIVEYMRNTSIRAISGTNGPRRMRRQRWSSRRRRRCSKRTSDGTRSAGLTRSENLSHGHWSGITGRKATASASTSASQQSRFSRKSRARPRESRRCWRGVLIRLPHTTISRARRSSKASAPAPAPAAAPALPRVSSRERSAPAPVSVAGCGSERPRRHTSFL